MVRIVQVLCPERHCLCAALYLSEDGLTKPERAVDLQARMTRVGLEFRCGICKSTDITIEDRATGFETMEEAEPVFRKCEAEQLTSRVFLDSIRN
jgi:hypothetical protein